MYLLPLPLQQLAAMLNEMYPVSVEMTDDWVMQGHVLAASQGPLVAHS
jgi:hypothetical protein